MDLRATALCFGRALVPSGFRRLYLFDYFYDPLLVYALRESPNKVFYSLQLLSIKAQSRGVITIFEL